MHATVLLIQHGFLSHSWACESGWFFSLVSISGYILNQYFSLILRVGRDVSWVLLHIGLMGVEKVFFVQMLVEELWQIAADFISSGGVTNLTSSR